jgi:hypothetical protein
MIIEWDFLYGFAFGLVIATQPELEELGCEWGFMLMIGPLVLDISKPA